MISGVTKISKSRKKVSKKSEKNIIETQKLKQKKKKIKNSIAVRPKKENKKEQNFIKKKKVKDSNAPAKPDNAWIIFLKEKK